MAIHQPDIIEWHDEVPVSTRFGDPYYSVDNGLAESAHVFLKGNGLPARFVSGLNFNILFVKFSIVFSVSACDVDIDRI